MDNIHRSLAAQGLVRPRDGRILGGVCAGLGARIGLDPWPSRILFVLLMALIPGAQVFWLYPILWILMPSQEETYPAQNPVQSPAPPAASA